MTYRRLRSIKNSRNASSTTRDLQRYEEELKKRGRGDDGSDSEDSSSEEEFDDLSRDIPQIFDGIIKLKNNHSILKIKDAKLFPSDSESDESDKTEKKKNKEKKRMKKKPIYLKDVISKQLLENGPEPDDEDMGNDDYDAMGNMVKSYSEEQEELRREFLKAAEKEGRNDEEGDLLREKNGESEEEDEEDDIEDKLDEILGDDNTLEDKDKEFLKDFWKNKRYIDNDKKPKDPVDDNIELSEDEELIEKQEDFERSYNFRYEENAGDRIMGYSRKVDGSVRKKENARKSQRERKEERIAQAEFERKEELKRLKNLKKKEINEKLEKIREVAGFEKGNNVFLNEDDLEKEFNPDEYDQKMKTAFGDQYYKADDVSPEFGSDEDEDEKPDFGKEDDLLGLPKGWDEVEEPADNGDEEPAEKVDEEPVEGKRKRKRKPSDMEKALRDQLMEDYYKLDYEGTVGDLKTRFKYKQVESKKFGLSPLHILMSDDKDLNEFVPLKKLATYQDKEWEVPRKKTNQLKEKIKEAIKVLGEASGETSNSTINKRKKIQTDSKEATRVAGEASDSGCKIKKKKTNVDGKGATEVVKAVPSEGSQSTESNDKKNTLSRKSRRRQNQRELKLSIARKMSYEVKSKNKK